MTHAGLTDAGRIWHALDRLAFNRGLTPSGLARAAGLDATTFNPSRRRDAQGQFRWPSMSSIFAVLSVLQLSFSAFAEYFDAAGEGEDLNSRAVSVLHLPVLPLSCLSEKGLFDGAGYPQAMVWNRTTLPGVISPSAYAVRVDTDALEPVMREESYLILEPELTPRWHDRVLLSQPGRPPVVGLWVPGVPDIVAPFFSGHSVQESEAGRGVAVSYKSSDIWVHRIISVTF